MVHATELRIVLYRNSFYGVFFLLLVRLSDTVGIVFRFRVYLGIIVINDCMLSVIVLDVIIPPRLSVNSNDDIQRIEPLD